MCSNHAKLSELSDAKLSEARLERNRDRFGIERTAETLVLGSDGEARLLGLRVVQKSGKLLVKAPVAAETLLPTGTRWVGGRVGGGPVAN